MNIALFLTPKSEVVTLRHRYSLKEAMDTMAKFRYTSVPVIDRRGHYVNALSEGDLLYYINEHSSVGVQALEDVAIAQIKRHHKIRPVSINASMDSLIDLVAIQSFVPVVDDDNVFIGIIKRSDIINYAVDRMAEKQKVLVS